jgi:hypothetical protein
MIVLSNIDPDTPLGKIQLAGIATETVSDEQFEKLFRDFKIKDEKGLDDLLKILEIMKVNRPVLYQKYEKQILELTSTK